MKIGLIGAGNMGTLHLRSALGNPLLQFTAVCDTDKSAAEKLAALCGAEVYIDLDQMLEEAGLDAVVIATPDHLHAGPVIKAANAKKAILLEKPFATTREDAREMLKAIRRNNTFVQMIHLFRFIPFYMNMKAAVRTGEFGEIVSTSATSLNKIFVPTKMLRWAANSSPSWFLLSHSIDAIMWLCECRVKKLSAVGIKRKLVSMGIDTYDLVKVSAEMENGAAATFEANWILPDTTPITASVQMLISGTEGAMTLSSGDPILTKATPHEYSIPGILEYDMYGYYSGVRRSILETFARSVERKTRSVTDEMDGYNAFCVLEAIDLSMAQGSKEVTVEY